MDRNFFPRRDFAQRTLRMRATESDAANSSRRSAPRWLDTMFVKGPIFP